MSDPFDAAKRDLEERDRTKMLADDARAILNKLDYVWEGAPQEPLIKLLMRDGAFSWNDARRSLEFILWEDSEAE
jgi:hypothetical protein